MITASNLLARVPPLFSDLAKILVGEIDCSHETLTHYASDTSPYFVLPQAVIFPKNVIDIKHILSFAREYTMPVTVRGNGNGKNGGALSEGIIIDMTRYFSQIRSVNMMENTVTVDAGVTIQLLIEKLHAWKFDIPFITEADKDSTVGAIIANKSASGSSFCHGTIREWVEGMTIVVDNGEEHKIADGITPSGRLLGIYQSVFPLLTHEGPNLRAAKPKSHDDSTGYNLWSTSIGPRQLIEQIVGSEGTLGIVTSVTFRVSPYKPHKITTCIPILEKNLISVYTEIAKHHTGEHIFLYDKMFMYLAERYHPMVVPFFEDTSYVLLVTHTSNDKEKLHHIVRNFKNALPLYKEEYNRIQETNNLNKITDPAFLTSLFDMYTNSTLIPITVADGLIVESHAISLFLEEIESYLDSLGNLYTVTGNVGSGHISVITLFDNKSKNYDESIIEYAKKIFSIVKSYNGGISVSGGEGLSRTPFLPYMYNSTTMSIFKKVKDVWDPLSILNPGKKTGVTINYIQQHLKRG